MDSEDIQKAILAALDKRQAMESTFEDLAKAHAVQAKNIDDLIGSVADLAENAQQMLRNDRAMLKLIEQGREESRRQHDDIRRLVLALGST